MIVHDENFQIVDLFTSKNVYNTCEIRTPLKHGPIQFTSFIQCFINT